MSTSILIVDDHKIVRDGLRSLLEKEPDLQVIAESDDGRTAVQMVRQLAPHLVIMDIGMPGLNGIDATRQILSEMPDVKVVTLSMHLDRRFVAEMFKAGASAYLLKDCAFEELVHAVRAVLEGKVYVSSGVAGLVVEDFLQGFPHTPPSAFSLLSPREREVLQLLVEGKVTREISSSLHVSVKTVETHRRQIMNKLNIRSIPELVKYAIREGLTSAAQS